MPTEMGKLAGIGGGLIMNIVRGIGILAFAVFIFYATRWLQKNSKKQKSFTINADIVDMNGVLEFDKLAFVKGEETGLLEMIFQNRKTDTIPPIPKHLIRGGHCLLLNYAPGHYAVVDTAKTLRNFQMGINKVELFNLGMKKYITAKQREIMNKAEKKRKNWELYAPWITLGLVIILSVLLAAFLFYFGVKFDSSNVANRLAECQSAGWK